MKALEILKEQYNMLSKDTDGVWIDPEKIDEAIKELEEYESDMDSYLDYTTGSRCTKSFNSCLGSIKIAYGKELEKLVKENSEDRLAELEALQNENKSLVKTLEKMNEEMIELRKENQDLKNSNNELLKGLKSTQKRLEEWLENASSNREKR